VRLLAESEQNGGEKGKSVRFSAQRPSPERALCVCIVANSLSFLSENRKSHKENEKARKRERHATHVVSLNSQLPCNFDFS
jgi:hypothetical protein